jgi:hypothetical protein
VKWIKFDGNECRELKERINFVSRGINCKFGIILEQKLNAKFNDVSEPQARESPVIDSLDL